MAKRYVNKKHLMWVTELDCCIKEHYDNLRMMGIAPKQISECSDFYNIQAHHLLKPFYSSRGMSLKASDNDVIPLCEKHHRELHLCGNEYTFFEKVVLNSRFGILTVQKVWNASPYNKEEDNDRIQKANAKRISAKTFGRKQKNKSTRST
tara:strand:+ start:29 stop:478 length:450 start_codon:yes stop_codon:yes gene_type:complete